MHGKGFDWIYLSSVKSANSGIALALLQFVNVYLDGEELGMVLHTVDSNNPACHLRTGNVDV